MTAEWTDLPTKEKGKDVVYTVEEYDVPKGYRATVSDTSVSEDKMTATVTNTYSKTPIFGEDVIYVDPLNPNGKMVLTPKQVDKSKVNTGDDNMLYVWIWILLLSAAALVMTAMKRNRDMNGRYDGFRPKH